MDSGSREKEERAMGEKEQREEYRQGGYTRGKALHPGGADRWLVDRSFPPQKKVNKESRSRNKYNPHVLTMQENTTNRHTA